MAIGHPFVQTIDLDIGEFSDWGITDMRDVGYSSLTRDLILYWYWIENSYWYNCMHVSVYTTCVLSALLYNFLDLSLTRMLLFLDLSPDDFGLYVDESFQLVKVETVSEEKVRKKRKYRPSARRGSPSGITDDVLQGTCYISWYVHVIFSHWGC